MSVTDDSDLNVTNRTSKFRYREIRRRCNVNDFVQSVSNLEMDEEGDLIVPRNKNSWTFLDIEHSEYTDVDYVGLQIWDGAFLLCDFILDNGDKFRDKNVLELGSGTGIVGIIASKYCSNIICTDKNNPKLLKTIETNFTKNKANVDAEYEVLELDFYKPLNENIIHYIQRCDICLASEVIYDNTISRYLINTLVEIFTINKNINFYFSVEKRYIFTKKNQITESHFYDFFFSELRKQFSKQFINYKLEPINNIPQFFYDYERVKNAELWHLRICTS